MTERLHLYFSLSCTGERNGNPLQCSCLENPRDGGAWWAAVYGVTQSQILLNDCHYSYRTETVAFHGINTQLPFKFIPPLTRFHLSVSLDEVSGKTKSFSLYSWVVLLTNVNTNY